MTITSSLLVKGLVDFFHPSRYDALVHSGMHRALLARVRYIPFVGADYKVPVLSAYAGGVTGVFTDAQTMGSLAPSIGRFSPGSATYAAELHKSFQISSQDLARAQDGKGAKQLLTDVIKNYKGITEATLTELERQLVQGSQLAAVTNTSYATTSLTMTPAMGARFIKKGMVLVVSATAGAALRTGTLTAASDGNPITGTVVTTANLSDGIAAIATNDIIYVKGTSPVECNCVKSCGAWATTPTGSEDFLAQDRSVAAAQLAFLATTGSYSTMLKSLQAADAYAGALNGGSRNLHLMSNGDLALLAYELGTQIQYSPGTSVKAGFAFVTANTQSGPVECVGHPFVPDATSYLLNQPSLMITGVRAKPVMMDDMSGTPMIPIYNASGYEFRAHALGVQFCSEAPGTNIKIAWS